VITKSPSRAISAVWSAASCQSDDERDLRRVREPLADERAGHAGHGVLAGAVHVEHDGLVGVLLEHVGELLREGLRAAVGVRLVDRDDAPVAHDGARRGRAAATSVGWCA
jgi:hypothetical protein